MTTVQTMFTRRVGFRALGVLLIALIGSCAKAPELVPPQTLVAPYDSLAGDALWAVVPLANESGTTTVDPLAVGDALVARITEVEGLAGVPMNRTMAAMRALGMPSVRTAADARWLAELLGADGIIVGTITSYDPYTPPRMGLALALFAKDGGAMRHTPPAGGLDPRALQKAYSEGKPAPSGRLADRPVAVVSEQLEGSNHGVQMSLQRYAEGRQPKLSALGWRRYLASMDLYTEFATHWAIRRLLEEERLRLAQPETGVREAADSRSTVAPHE